MLANLPEMKLGQDDPGQFSAERVAAILTDWVTGVSVPEMVAKYADASKPLATRASSFTSYLYSSLTGKVSWGMGALQKVSWAGSGTEPVGDAVHVPSMIFYGVGTKEAVWMRMAGLPRDAATRAAKVWREAGVTEPPTSYAQLRKFVDGISADRWEASRGSSAISGEQMLSLWDELG
jgi:hypothetical protein